jgi:formylglycine-generating enzyme required for sulfatase activity
MEYLAAIQLLVECRENQERLKRLVESFNDNWWEETLRFFICKSDGIIFDRFMKHFFLSKESQSLSPSKEKLLIHLVSQAPQRKIDSMVQLLKSEKLNEKKKRYILNCLKVIDTPESITAVDKFLKENKPGKTNLVHAKDIVAELGGKYGLSIEESVEECQSSGIPGSLRNSFEGNVEYIKIPGGTYKFSVSKKMETVSNLYFCKYPVTNKRYRRFISYLEGKLIDIEQIVPLKIFAEKLLEFAATIKKYAEYLGTNYEEWQHRLRSRYDDDKRFNGEDQPVVGISWYAARSYCFWLSLLHRQGKRQIFEKSLDMVKVANIYRLPIEVEWEWAAAGRRVEGILRKYPWKEDNSEPEPFLANYNENVGTTTTVGIYPDGAAPEGLMDMGGNVWEWMGNWIDDEKNFFALRGGSWSSNINTLRCTSRHFYIPDCTWDDLGFRVIFTQA